MSERPGPRPRLFDAWSRFYDLRWFQWLNYRPVHNAVLAALRQSDSPRVLDVGCGTGLLASRIRRELHGTRVVGCDFSSGMLERAAAGTQDVAWVRGNALRLPFRTSSFEAVVSTEAFHWFPDQAAALGEFFRVLTPGGWFLLGVMSPASEGMSRALRIGSRLLAEPSDWPTRRRLRAQLEDAGFKIETQQRIYRLPGGLLLPPFLTVATRPA